MKNFAEIYKENASLFGEIYSSIKTSNMTVLKDLLTLHPDMLHIPCYGGALNDKGLLHLATRESENVQVCMYLIDQGINVNALDYSRHTPLISAADEGKNDLVKALIERGAWVNGSNSANTTPLIEAARGGHFEVVKTLIDNGADINRFHAMNRTALDIATAYKKVNDNVRVIDLLKSIGALKAHEPIELSKERASGVLEKIHNDVGTILSTKLSRGSIDLRTSLLKNDKDNKILFTIGGFQQLPRVELIMCVPSNWPVNQNLINENTLPAFPMQLLFALAEHRLSGGELREGFIIEKQSADWNHLKWPEKIDGFIAVDYAFGSTIKDEKIDDDTVTLLLLVPIKCTKVGWPKGKKLDDWITKRQTAKWAKNALRYDDLNDNKRF